MKTYKIPVQWVMTGEIEVQANSLKEAIEAAYDADLPQGEYLDDSFMVEEDNLEDEEKEV